MSFELFEDTPNLGSDLQKLLWMPRRSLKPRRSQRARARVRPKGIITAIAAVGGSVVGVGGQRMAVADISPIRRRSRPAGVPTRGGPRTWHDQSASQLPIAGSGALPIPSSTTPRTRRACSAGTCTRKVADGRDHRGRHHERLHVISGDFKQYIIADRIGTKVSSGPTCLGLNVRPTGQGGSLLHWRTGADAVITDAFRLTNYSG